MHVALRALPLVEARALLAGSVPTEQSARWHPQYPTADTVDALRMLDAAHEALGVPLTEEPSWWLHQIVVADQVVGDVGFHGPPAAERWVEIGYQVVPDRRGRGIATAAVAQLLPLAWRQGVDEVRAETDPDNFASQWVLRSNGFVQGADQVFRLARPQPAEP